jgi:hypothetical protein
MNHRHDALKLLVSQPYARVAEIEPAVDLTAFTRNSSAPVSRGQRHVLLLIRSRDNRSMVPMLIPEGTLATTEEVRARWAHGEMTSDRFGQKYVPHVPSHLLASAKRGDAFSTVDRSQWVTLSNLLDRARPGEYLHRDLLKWSKFRCAHWTKEDLDGALAISAFNKQQQRPLTYVDFYQRTPDTGINQTAENSDPRVQAFRTPDTLQAEPAVAILHNSQYLLVDGYLRSIIFRRQRDPDLRFAVWVPMP